MTKKEIEEDCYRWYEEIKESYVPELIVFIAKSGFLFARPLSEYFGCKMVDIVASRLDNGQKDRIKKLIPRIPKHLLAFLLIHRVTKARYHEDSMRIVTSSPRLNSIDFHKYNKILIVDDSVDTGWSLIKVMEYLDAHGALGKYKTASYCALRESNNRVTVDFVRYLDTIVITATSRYSREYKAFIDSYNEWKKSNL